jgi:hypothetical protein
MAKIFKIILTQKNDKNDKNDALSNRKLKTMTKTAKFFKIILIQKNDKNDKNDTLSNRKLKTMTKTAKFSNSKKNLRKIAIFVIFLFNIFAKN